MNRFFLLFVLLGVVTQAHADSFVVGHLNSSPTARWDPIPATPQATPNTVVLRDAQGNFAGQLPGPTGPQGIQGPQGPLPVTTTRLFLPYGGLPSGTAAVGMGGLSNQLRCARFVPPLTLTVTKLAFAVVTSAVNSVGGIAVYQDADAGTRLLTTSGLATTSAGAKTATGLPAQTLVAGTAYRYCWCNSTLLPKAEGVAAGGGQLMNLAGAFVPSLGTAANPCAAGVPPVTTGVLTSANIDIVVGLASAE